MGFGIKSVSSSSFLANTPCAGINAKAASFVVVVVVVVVLVLPPLSAFIIFVRISEVKAERCRAALHESVVLVIIMEVVVALDDDDDDDDDVEGAGEDRDEAQLKNRAEARSDDGACASVIIL